MTALPTVRSILFVPGIRPEFIPKALSAEADALVLDLEDSVSHHAKTQAREHVSHALRQASDRLTLVRINHPSCGMLEDDLAVLAPHPLQMIVLPKVESPLDVQEADRLLAAVERKHGLKSHSIGMMVVVESSLGLRVLYDSIGASDRVSAAALASAEEGDFLVEIGGAWTPDGTALAYARGKFVCDARAAKVPWLLDGAFMNLSNTQALERESRLARTYGFNGKMAIHPRQVPVINQVFGPSDAEVARARALLNAFRAAEAQGRAAVQFDGMMVDYANVKRAEQILALAGQSSG
jgi:citrate lyase subunit beta/citryl-CoA lyase